MSFYLIKMSTREEVVKKLGYGLGNNEHESVVEWLTNRQTGYPLYPGTEDPYLKLFFVIDRSVFGAASPESLSSVEAIEYFVEVAG